MRNAEGVIRVVLAAVLAVTLGAAVGCSSDRPVKKKPAVCTSVERFESSVAALKKVDVGKGGLAKVRTDLGRIRSDLQQVVDDARGEFSRGVKDVRDDLTGLDKAVGAAITSPSAATKAAVGSALSTLIKTADQLVDDVRSTC